MVLVGVAVSTKANAIY